LKVKENRHPITLYKEFGVPIVISTDDAGILRTNMTEQYVLLAKRYKDISYSDIKQFVYNSINYSFIKEESVKESLVDDLDIRFQNFEANFEAK
jgi:adenosine deaminase/adenosine deaminase CECR1